MRCPKCNFVSRTDFDVCPYCKHQNNVHFFMHHHVRLRDGLEITVGSIALIIGINLFVATLVVDVVTKFQFNISFFVLSLLAFFSLITGILSKPLIARSIWKIDAYVIFVCCIALLYFNEYGGAHVGFGANDYFCGIIANYVLPCEFIIFVSLETIVLFIDKKNNSVQMLFRCLGHILCILVFSIFSFTGLWKIICGGYSFEYANIVYFLALGVVFSFFVSMIILSFSSYFGSYR